MTEDESTRLGVALTSAAQGAVVWRTCASCGYAALHAEPKSAGGGVAIQTSADAVAAAPAARAGGAAASQRGLQGSVRAAAAAFGPFERSAARSAPREPDALQIGLVYASAALGLAGPVLLFLAARSLLGTGGIATDPVYEVASVTSVSAPGWVWLMPFGAMTMMAAFLVNVLVAHDLRRPHLIAVFWSALFGLLGAQSLAYGLTPAPGGEVQWGWVAVGGVLCALAVPAVTVIFLREMWIGFDGRYRTASLLGLASGVVLALTVFPQLFA